MKSLFGLMVVAFAFVLFSNDTHAQNATGVFINSQELSSFHKAQLEEFTGLLLPAHYYVDQYGFMGVVGYPPAFNLNDMIQYKRALVDGNFPPQFRDSNPFMRNLKFLEAQNSLGLKVAEIQNGKLGYSYSGRSGSSSSSGDYYERTDAYSRGREGNTSFYMGNSRRGNNTGVTTDGETTILMNRSGEIIRTY